MCSGLAARVVNHSQPKSGEGRSKGGGGGGVAGLGIRPHGNTGVNEDQFGQTGSGALKLL